MMDNSKTRRLAFNKNAVVYLAILIVFIIVGLFAPKGAETYGAWTLIPPVLMFLFVLTTRKILEGFLWGSIMAVFMKYKAQTLTVYNDKLVDQLKDPDNLSLIIIFLLFGCLIAIFERSGVAAAFGEWASKKAKGSKMGLFITYLMTLVLSIDDYLSALTVGTCMTPVNDKFKTPREMNALVLRTTAVPPCALHPIGSWSIFVAGLLVANKFAAPDQGMAEYMKIVPFLFYPILIIILTLLVIIGVIPKFGPMKKAYERVAAGGSVSPEAAGETDSSVEAADAEGSPEAPAAGKKPARIINFFIPIIVLIASTIYFDMNIQLGLITTVVVTAIVFIAQGIFNAEEYIDTMMVGMKDMLMLIILLVISFVVSSSVDEIGFTKYIVGMTGTMVSAHLLPFIIFAVFAVTEFLVSLNWALYIMAIPIIIPLCTATGANVYLTLGALISAGIWGSNACFYSDAGIVVSASGKIDLYKHGMSTLPYAIIAMVLSAAAFLVAGFIF
ncbi:Na+/H+ antiporter NhaC family protein [Paenibacillus tuaregi]|uniref:Na+/H+ antiporter NhaC family protein n=1 Tax=Paenibacillus tuaregi TaxID=1816681 RepID=UPI0009EEA4BC|nr:Na+/H+ antiporter NhaC family protein [Paenibacillus tuaregi]